MGLNALTIHELTRRLAKKEIAAAEPPEDPPGIRVVSHGLRVTWNAEFSVELPIANSSMFSRPNGIAPAARSFATAVAS